MKTKIGRPKLPKGEVRSVYPLRLSDAEREQYEAKANAENLSLPKWMRKVLTQASK